MSIIEKIRKLFEDAKVEITNEVQRAIESEDWSVDILLEMNIEGLKKLMYPKYKLGTISRFWAAIKRHNEAYADKKWERFLPYLGRYNGHCVSIMRRNLFVTYAHMSNDIMRPGVPLKYPVVLYNGQQVNCRVLKRSRVIDCVWLEPLNPEVLPLDIQDLEIESLYYCQKIVIVGASGVFQLETDLSFDVCYIACSTIDEQGHAKSNKKTCPGESGGPVFDFKTEKFVGMQIGAECVTGILQHNARFYGGRGEIVPATLMLNELAIANVTDEKKEEEMLILLTKKSHELNTRVSVRTSKSSESFF